MHGFKTTDLVVLIVYLLSILIIGLYFSKKDMKGKEFFKGDGTIPWYVTSVSIFATLLSPISFLSLVGNSFAGSWILWFAQVGAILAIPITIKFFLPIFSKLKIDTAYQYLELRYGSKSLRLLGAILFIVYQLGRMSIIMYLPSKVLAELMGVNVDILIIVMGIISIIYSSTGGLKSVLWTDFIQGVVLLVGVVFAFVYLVSGIDGGFGAIFSALSADRFIDVSKDVIFSPNIFQTSIFMIIIGALLNTLSSYISSQDIVQRFTTTTDEKKLNKMMLTNGALSIFVATVLYLIGTALFVYNNQHPLPGEHLQDQVFGTYIAYVLPTGITGLLLAAIYAAAQSTLSTGLNSVATSWTLDIQDIVTKKELSFKNQTLIAQGVSVLVGIVAIIVSIVMAHSNIQSAYDTFNGFMGLILGILGGIFILGAFFKSSNKYGAWAGFVAASVVLTIVRYVLPGYGINVTIWANSLIAITVCVIVGIIVSKITSKQVNYPAPECTTIYHK